MNNFILVRLLAWHINFEKHETFKERFKRKIIVCSMASKRMVGLVLARKRDKGNRTDFD